MIKNYKKQLNIAFLLIFLITIITINFFHIEKCLVDKNKFCPACDFLNSSLTTSHINFFHLPPPAITGLLRIFESFHYKYITYITPASRSPPQI